jgi:ABC-2 type transport system permease protein
MRRTLAVIERDMRKFRRNPFILATAVVLPVVYLVILGNSFQGNLRGLPVAVVQSDPGPHGRRMAQVLQALEAGPATARLVPVASEAQAVQGVREGRYKAALVIPPEFSRKAELRAGPEVGFFVDNTDGVSAAALAAAFASAVASLGEEYVPVRSDLSRVQLRRVDLYRRVDYDQTLVPGVVVMAIFLGTMITGVFNLVMDRFLGVDEAILLTPLTKADIVVGLVTSGFCITLAMALTVLTLSALITQLPIDLSPLRALSTLAVVALTTLGLLAMMFALLGRANHPRIVGLLSGFLNVILFFPSGAVYPVESFPSWLRAFAAINPEYYAVHALRAVVIKGGGFSTVAGDVAYLAAFAGLMMAVAVATFKRTL